MTDEMIREWALKFLRDRRLSRKYNGVHLESAARELVNEVIEECAKRAEQSEYSGNNADERGVKLWEIAGRNIAAELRALKAKP